jgi:hypothetical protein
MPVRRMAAEKYALPHPQGKPINGTDNMIAATRQIACVAQVRTTRRLHPFRRHPFDVFPRFQEGYSCRISEDVAAGRTGHVWQDPEGRA